MSKTSPPDLGQMPFFSSIPDGLRRSMQGCLLRWDLAPGAVIMRVGERPGFMAIVGQGRLEQENAAGEVQMIEVGSAFGEAMMRYGVPSAHIVRVVMPTTLWILWRSDWLAVKRDHSSTPSLTIASFSAKSSDKAVMSSPRKSRRLRIGCLLLPITMALVIYFLGPTLFSFFNRSLVDVALKVHHPQVAVEYLGFVLQFNPNAPELHDALGYLLFNQGDSNAALVHFQQAVRQDENLAVAQNNLGVALLDLGQAQEAISHLEVAVDLDPSNADAYTNLGDAYLTAGEMKEATRTYQRAFELDSSQLEAKTRWAGIALEQGEIDQARKAWEEVVVLNPRIAQAQRGLGVISVLQERPIDALLYLKAALLIDPSDAITYIYLGVAMEALDRPDEAVVEYVQALSKSTDPALVDWVQARLVYLNQQSTQGSANQKGGANFTLP